MGPIFLHVEQRLTEADAVGNENGLRIAISEGLEQIKAGEEFEGELVRGDLGVRLYKIPDKMRKLSLVGFLRS